MVTTINQARKFGKVPVYKASAILLTVQPGFSADSVVAAINRNFLAFAPGNGGFLPTNEAGKPQQQGIGNSGIGTSTLP